MKRATADSIPKSRRWTVAQARTVLEAQEKSGLPVTQFASRHGLCAERLYQWRRRLGREKSAACRPPRFTEVRLAVPSPAAIEIMLAGGVTLRFAGASRLDDAVAVLSRLAGR